MTVEVGEVHYIIDWPKVTFESYERARTLLEITLAEAKIVARRNVLYRKYPRAYPGASVKAIGLGDAMYSDMQRTGKGYTGKIGNRLSYAASVEHGAAPHVIRPRVRGIGNGRYVRGGYLYFYWWNRGYFVKTRKVYHPGQTGKHYLRDALISVGKRRGFAVDIY
jgi:hypothetical protein